MKTFTSIKPNPIVKDVFAIAYLNNKKIATFKNINLMIRIAAYDIPGNVTMTGNLDKTNKINEHTLYNVKILYPDSSLIYTEYLEGDFYIKRDLKDSELYHFELDGALIKTI